MPPLDTLPTAWRLFPVLLFLVCDGSSLSTAVGEDQTKTSGETTENVNVLSYNIHMWQIGVDDLATIIRQSGADIVGLNEAWNEKKNEAIAQELGFNAVYGGRSPTEPHPAKTHTINGFYMPQVLLTKHKVIHSEVFNALAAKDHERFDSDVPIHRGGTLAVLETAKGNRIVVFVLHLHPWGEGSDEKMTSMRLQEIEGIAKKLQPYQDLPVVILGDFNTQSHVDVDGGWKVTRFLESQGYEDLYRTTRPDPQSHPGQTFRDTRIDYIFHNQHCSAVSSQVVQEGVFGSRGYDQSDHLAISGVLKVETSTKPAVHPVN
ncbi:endonuclease/exonuclease/phosphatase family protein [Rhodopirellula islandica]|nr:endonuclease/exonuclease/phosphatase family protein [Rhodopirellula islandica]